MLSPRATNAGDSNQGHRSPVAASSPPAERETSAGATSPKAAQEATTHAQPVAASSESSLQSPRRGGSDSTAADSSLGSVLPGQCAWCKEPMGRRMGSMSPDGPVHNECVVKYRLHNVVRCAHCGRSMKGQRIIVGGVKLHPECLQDYKAKKPFVPRTRQGFIEKFPVGRGTGLLSGKTWQNRYFTIERADNGGSAAVCYFESQEASQRGPSSAKGSFPLSREKTRLITRPMRKHHPEASNVSREFVIVFFEGSTERRLLCRCPSWEEHDAWCDVLEDYLQHVDSAADEVEIAS